MGIFLSAAMVLDLKLLCNGRIHTQFVLLLGTSFVNPPNATILNLTSETMDNWVPIGRIIAHTMPFG